jgi:hypothetical protein
MAELKKVPQLTEVLQEYWEDKKGNANFPAAADIDGTEIESIWQNCYLVEVIDGGAKFMYEYLGDSIVEACGNDLEGTFIVDDLIYPETPEATAKLREVVKDHQPLVYDGAFINHQNQDIKFRKILLPLGAGNTVNYILGGMIWKAF